MDRKKSLLLFAFLLLILIAIKVNHNIAFVLADIIYYHGDVDNNGVIDKYDAISIAKYIIDGKSESDDSFVMAEADVNQDGKIKMNDVMLILSGKVGIPESVIDITAIEFDNVSGSIDANKTIDLNAKIIPENATNKKLTWKSSDNSVATVDSTGKVTGIKGGIATITATSSNNIQATYHVTVNITPSKIIEIDTTNAGLWRIGQGMCTANVDGKNYYIAATIQKDNKPNTHIYIIDSDGNVVAIVSDYQFSHANGMAASNDYIYIYNSVNTLFRINMKNYIKDAINEYKLNGEITENFTENYVSEFTIPKARTKSIFHDKNSNSFYGTNEKVFYKIETNEDTKEAITTKLFNYPDSEGYLNAANAGLAVWGDYILKAVVYIYTESHPYYENIIDIYKFDNPEKTSVTYVSSYKFASANMKTYEIEDIDLIDDNTLAVYYSRSSKYLNHIYLIDPHELLNY